MSEAGKKWHALDDAEKQKFKDQANAMKEAYLEYKKALKEQQANGEGGAADEDAEDEEALMQQRRK